MVKSGLTFPELPITANISATGLRDTKRKGQETEIRTDDGVVGGFHEQRDGDLDEAVEDVKIILQDHCGPGVSIEQRLRAQAQPAKAGRRRTHEGW